jgi:drug/metabolite transporter (DMT)-like permease
MVQQKDISGLAWKLLALLALIWGGSFLSIRIALDEIGPLTSVAHRTFWAMLVLWGFVFWKHGRISVTRAEWSGFLGMGHWCWARLCRCAPMWGLRCLLRV